MRRTLSLGGSLGLISALLVLAPVNPAASAGSAVDDVETDYGRMMLVLDSSGSMKEKATGGQTKIAAAKDALTTVIDDLPDDADVGLQVFGAEVFSRNDKGACQDTQVVVEPGTDNRDDLKDAVAGYKPYGETPIPAALQKASDSLGSEGKRSIVLVSDGESTCGNPCRVAEEVASAGIDVQIDVVGLSVSGKAKRQLQCIADKGNGTYYDAEDSEELTESLDRIKDRAVKPFVVAGQPVTGTDAPTDAPEIEAGSWRDAMPAEGEARHYRIKRSIPGSTIWVGVVAQPNTDQQQIALQLSAGDDKDCGSEWDYNSIGGTDTADLIGVAVPSGDEEWCTDAETLDLAIAKTEWSAGASDAPMQINVFEEPPLASADGLPAGEGWNTLAPWQKMEVSGDLEEVTPGSALADAPLLEPGGYRTGGILPGEVQVFRVHLDWGQSLQAQAVLPVNKAGYDAYGIQAPLVSINVMSPLGGALAIGSIRDEYDEYLDDRIFPPTEASQGTERAHAKTSPVRYLNRTKPNQENVALPGDYYVVVTQQSDSGGDAVITPFDLEIDVLTEDEDAAPAYPDGAEIQGPHDQGESESGDSEDGGSDEASGGSSDESDTLKLVAGGSALGLGVIALAAGGLMLLRRRRPSS